MYLYGEIIFLLFAKELLDKPLSCNRGWREANTWVTEIDIWSSTNQSCIAIMACIYTSHFWHCLQWIEEVSLVLVRFHVATYCKCPQRRGMTTLIFPKHNCLMADWCFSRPLRNFLSSIFGKFYLLIIVNDLFSMLSKDPNFRNPFYTNEMFGRASWIKLDTRTKNIGSTEHLHY